jgi:hypothetical protein
LGVPSISTALNVDLCLQSSTTWRLSVLNRWPVSKIIGSALGGTLAGISLAVLGQTMFGKLQGPAVNASEAIFAVACSTIFMSLGILFPETKGPWPRTFVILTIEIIVTVTIAVVADSTSLELVKPVEGTNNYRSPFSRDVLILGSICGLMSGLQVGSALWLYDRFKNKFGRGL